MPPYGPSVLLAGSPPVIPAGLPHLSFPPVLSGNPSSTGIQGGWNDGGGAGGNDRAYWMMRKRKATGFPIKNVGNDRKGVLREG